MKHVLYESADEPRSYIVGDDDATMVQLVTMPAGRVGGQLYLGSIANHMPYTQWRDYSGGESLARQILARVSGVEESLRESHEAAGEDGEPLARFYAELCDALDRAGATTEAQTIADEANEELAGSGWQVTRGESGWAATAGVEESLREAREGRTVGVPFQGASGRWFVVRQGNDGRKRVVPWADHDAQPRAAKARVAARAEKGSVDRQALLSRLAKHTEGQEPNAAQQAWAKSAARMFTRHHGENALHRIEDLADTIEGALAKIQGDGLREQGARRDLQGKLRQLHLAMGAMGDGTGQPTKPSADDTRTSGGTGEDVQGISGRPREGRGSLASGDGGREVVPTSRMT